MDAVVMRRTVVHCRNAASQCILHTCEKPGLVEGMTRNQQSCRGRPF